MRLMHRSWLVLAGLLAGCGQTAGVGAIADADVGSVEDTSVVDGSGASPDAALDGSSDPGDAAVDVSDPDTATDAAVADADASIDATDISEARPDAVTDGSADTVTDSTEDASAGCAETELLFGADLDTSGVARPASFGACADAAHALVAAAGTSWSVEATGLADGTIVSAYGPSFFSLTAAGEEPSPLATSAPARAGIARVTFAVATAGEQVVVLRRPGALEADAYSVAASCAGACLREATRFPIVLVHGYAGVDSYFGILDYFHDVKPTLNEVGYVTYTPVTDPIATSERRSAQLGEQIDAILAETGAQKVNLVCHSQGGLDARMLVASGGYADRVASITTIATPHGGIPLLLADFLSVQDFSPDAMVAFNAANPDQPGVRYWSWSSRSCGILEPGCRDRSENELVDVLLGASYTLLLRFGENDGIVPTASMAWGENLGMIFADHFDEVGQIADGTPDGDPFDHRAFYLSEARRLRAAGL